MTWSISQSGPKEDVYHRIVALAPPSEAANAEQFERVRELVLDEVEDAPGPNVSISCSGHVDAASGYLSMQLNLSIVPPPEPSAA